jgi:uncharacterized protein
LVGCYNVVMIPTDQQIEALHHKYAPSDTVFDWVYVHCKIIDDTAAQLLDTHPSLSVNRQLVHVGCMLHDIGVYTLFDAERQLKANVNYIQHGIRGAEILEAEGYPEQIVRFASCHTGVGLTRDDVERQNLPIPAGDYTAKNIEELLIMYADKFHSKTIPPYFNSFEWYKQDIAAFGQDKVVAL